LSQRCSNRAIQTASGASNHTRRTEPAPRPRRARWPFDRRVSRTRRRRLPRALPRPPRTMRQRYVSRRGSRGARASGLAFRRVALGVALQVTRAQHFEGIRRQCGLMTSHRAHTSVRDLVSCRWRSLGALSGRFEGSGLLRKDDKPIQPVD
jgi:hypothetical protein